ncbi:ECF transporter S component [Vagococcus intermedius]|uniref:ECF transporter S component n=1 Tax=Vagococcus intermedius TaxID=2991418 RepID=A0AAF0CW04_9ENTE|nr:ECF transporter S component [Vagococcus intermedius]WEG73901.1 ECF transporter S component [Vagococcus intermedius]WEG75985.1 ECF transporter S component [Vagococcus intermedius]
MSQKKLTTADIIITALFATMTFIGTMIRIPVPSPLGAPFIHLGNAMLLLAVLLIGFKKGALAGGMGFAIFDILNGFAIEAPYFILESFIVGGIASITFSLFNKKDDHSYKIIIVALAAGITKLVMTFLKNTVQLLFLGTDFKLAIPSAIMSLPATVVNVISTIIIVSLAYYPLKKLVHNFYHKPN